MNNKLEFSDLIRKNILAYGFHLTIVQSKIEPRYAYTIGLNDHLNFELIFTGGVVFLEKDLYKIFGELVKEIKKNEDILGQTIQVNSLGFFSFSNVESSWSKMLMLGAFDYYNKADLKVFQVIPDENHFTLDIPNMSNKWDVFKEPIWQWLVRRWDYNVPEDSTVATNIDALKGEYITEIMRTENNEWEMFAGAGPEIDDKDIRIVSLGVILGIDKSILPAINLEIDKGLWRDSKESNWNRWG